MKNNYTGLTDSEAQKSRLEHGENVMTPPKKKSMWLKLLEKFTDPLIIILLVAGALSLGISCYEYFGMGEQASVFFEPMGIFVAVLLSTGLAFYFENRAEGEFELLNKVNDHEKVKVYRNGNLTELDKSKVVVGDILVLNSGDEICADAILLEAVRLRVDESSLTGESSCTKTIDPAEFDKEATFPSNQVYKGTNVIEGEAVCRVVAVGDHTEAGKVFEASRIDNSVRTPLNEQLDRLGGLISKLSYTLAALILIGRCIRYFNSGCEFELMGFLSYMLQSLMIAVTLVVVSVPEGLPMAVTLSLAYSMGRLLKSHSLVRKMHACETMGAVSVICTDKTGTLTQNQMRVQSALFPERLKENSFVAEALAVNSSASLDFSQEDKTNVIGNPTEGALLLYLKDCGIDYRPFREDIEVFEKLPFTTENKYMASVIASKALSARVLLLKGAPEIVLQMCDSFEEGFEQESVRAKLAEFQGNAMRTLAFAYKILENDRSLVSEGRLTERNLCFMGMVGIADPVRADVPCAVSECLGAGINIKMVTGDTSVTAKAIAKQVGLWKEDDSEDAIITGTELSELSDKELRQRIMKLKVISRARPMDKKLLVETLQDMNQVVAVTGDGTNDAPALKAAHVGLSMGDGTNVAKQASDITITDNSFTSIGRAVMWGRSLYQNIQRFILFQMIVNVVACLVVVFGAFLGEQPPLTVTQMLWVNLIMDTFAAMALASLPPNERVMQSKPRNRKDFIITKPMGIMIASTGVLFFAFLMTLLYVFKHYDIKAFADIFLFGECRGGIGISPKEGSMFFTVFVMLQFWNMFNAKAYMSGRSAFHFKNCGSFLLIAAIILAGQVAIVTFGGKMFSVTPLSVADWVVMIALTSLVMILGELARFANNHCIKAKA